MTLVVLSAFASIKFSSLPSQKESLETKDNKEPPPPIKKSAILTPHFPKLFNEGAAGAKKMVHHNVQQLSRAQSHLAQWN